MCLEAHTQQVARQIFLVQSVGQHVRLCLKNACDQEVVM